MTTTKEPLQEVRKLVELRISMTTDNGLLRDETTGKAAVVVGVPSPNRTVRLLWRFEEIVTPHT